MKLERTGAAAPGRTEEEHPDVEAVAAPFLTGPVVTCEEIGDGNLNFVYRVASASTSVIVKHALDYIRISGPQRPLTVARIGYEARALEVSNRLSPGSAPLVHHAAPAEGLLVMEDLRHHETLRTMLVRGTPGPERLDVLGTHLARIHLGTSAFALSPVERARYVEEFTNPEMVAHTLRVTFQRPYNSAMVDLSDPVVAGLAYELERDLPSKRRAAELGAEFCSSTESLIHGDMHTGSVMATTDDMRIIDPEFAMMGPIAFDLGCLFAHLVIAAARHRIIGDAPAAITVEEWARSFWSGYASTVRTLWSADPIDADWFLDRQMRRVPGYAGVEMVRRAVGGAYVPETVELQKTQRERAHHALASCGTALLHNEQPMGWGALWRVANAHLKAKI